MQFQTLLLLSLVPFIAATNSNLQHLHQKNSEPDLASNQDIEASLEERQAVAAGGGIVAATPVASQYPISTTAGSLFTVNGVTSATWKLFVQTFATTALDTVWELGATPAPGIIGLGNIAGTVGAVRSKRAVETPAPPHAS
ncbi:hypothetical protein QTJ16_005189 [Diplocarpon rosae]|uniref:Uncharacterized protein n=1 Tax=Diplocarpon rosae TaxID=946125 RepID=A0AAD9WBX6_9HELO|nr:hypothetical protein QTJ16_005189 [Diplocarpon rosae]PBP21457.1 hypothetical protein BUE80_DR007519 [Diplocarpon rosae]